MKHTVPVLLLVCCKPAAVGLVEGCQIGHFSSVLAIKNTFGNFF